MKRVRFLPIVLLLLLPSACVTGGDDAVTIDGNDAGTTVEVEQGETLRIELEGNPTTGYAWEVSAVDESVLHYEDSDFDADSDADGAGGIVTLEFEASGAGATLLELIYRPPWEPPSPSHQRYAVTVRVN